MDQAMAADETMRAAMPPAEAPLIRTIAIPGDTNPAGDIFGGWLMAQMDFVAGNVATRRARGRCATVAVEAIALLNPVLVGDEVSLYGHIAAVGRPSLQIAVEAAVAAGDEAADPGGGQRHSLPGRATASVATTVAGSARAGRF